MCIFLLKCCFVHWHVSMCAVSVCIRTCVYAANECVSRECVRLCLCAAFKFVHSACVLIKASTIFDCTDLNVSICSYSDASFCVYIVRVLFDCI